MTIIAVWSGAGVNIALCFVLTALAEKSITRNSSSTLRAAFRRFINIIFTISADHIIHTRVCLLANLCNATRHAHTSKQRNKGASSTPSLLSPPSPHENGDEDEVKYVELAWNEKLAKREIAAPRGGRRPASKKAARCVYVHACAISKWLLHQL